MTTMLNDDTYRGHRVHEGLRRLQISVEALSQAGREETPDGSASATRLGLFVPYAIQRLGGALPQLATQEDLDSIATPCEEIISAVGTMTTEPTANQWMAIDQSIGAALRHLTRLPLVEGPADLAALASGVDNARRKISGTLAAFTRQAKETRTEVQQLRDSTKKAIGSATDSQEQVENKADQIEARLDTLIVDLQTKFTEAQTVNAQRFQDEVDKRADNAKAVLNGFEKETKEAIASSEEALDGLLVELSNEATRRKEELAGEAARLIAELTRQKDEGVRLVEIIGSTGMTGAYQKQAKWSRLERYVWSAIAVAAFVGLVWIVLKEFDPNVGTSWPVVGVRVLISVTLLGLAGFAGVESKRAGDAERRYRRIELELASMGPYLADFPESERLRIKEELAKRIFGEEPVPELKQAMADGSLVKPIVEAVAAEVKRKR